MILFRRVAHAIAWRTRRVKRSLSTLNRRNRKPASSAPPTESKPKSKPKVHVRNSPENLYDGVDFLRSQRVEQAHEQTLERLRQRVQHSASTVKVGFVVSSAARWNGDALFSALGKDAHLDPSIVLCRPEYKVDRESLSSLYADQRKFFRDIDPNLTELYDPVTGEEYPIEDVDHDILFFEMPWGMKDFPRRMVGKALTAYMHYGFMMMANHEMHYNIASFHSYLWTYYTQTEAHRRMHLRFDPSADPRLVVSGYPKLDVYAEDLPKASDAWWERSDGTTPLARAIYAPHHSLGRDNLGMSTFPWSGEVARSLMLQDERIDWMYKPHPSLRYSVQRNSLMSADEYQHYEDSWRQSANAAIHDSGGYFNIFRTSDVLITCSGSFLAEYLPTGKPIIWLLSDRSVGLNEVGARLAEAFYVVRTADELAQVFEQVVLRGDDPLAERRQVRSQELFPAGLQSAAAVVGHLRSQLGLPAAS